MDTGDGNLHERGHLFEGYFRMRYSTERICFKDGASGLKFCYILRLSNLMRLDLRFQCQSVVKLTVSNPSITIMAFT